MLNHRRFISSSLLFVLFSANAVIAQEKNSVQEFKGHTDAVYSVSQSSDGKLLFTAGFDRTVRIWDTITGKQLRSFGGTTGHQSLVLSVATSPSGELLASGGSDNALFLWTVPLRNAVKEFAHTTAVVSHSLSADGKNLAALGKDGSIRIWQTSDGKTLRDIPPVKGRGLKGQFTANGQQFVVATDDGFIRWFNSADGKLIGSIGASRSTITGLMVFGGNSVATTDDEGQLKFWQTPSTQAKALPSHTDSITQLKLSADGGTIITIGNDRVAKSVSVNSGSVSKEITLPALVSASAIFPNGSTVAFGQPDGKIILWNRTDGKVIETLQAHAKKVNEIAVHPNGSSFVSIDEEGTANVWAFPIVKPKPAKDAKDPKDGGPIKPTMTFKLSGPVIGVAYHTSANQLLVLSADKTIKLIDDKTGKEVKSIATLAGVPKAFAISRDFSQIALGIDKSLRILNIADGKEVGNIPMPLEATSIAFNSDKTRLITGHVDKVARIWDVTKGGFVHSVEHSGPITGVAFNPNQQSVIVASSDKSSAMLPIQQPKIAATPKPIRTATITANASHIVVGGDDPIVRTFNTGNAMEDKKFEGATGPIYSVAVSKNVQTLASGGADKTVRIYQFNEMKPIATFAVPAVLRSLTFHPNGNIIVGITEDKLMTAWNVTQIAGQPLPDDFGSIIQQWTLPEVASGLSITETGEIYVGLAEKTVKQFKLALNTPIRNVAGHPNLVDAVAFSPDGKFLASGCHDGVLRVFETEKFANVKTIQAHTTPAPAAAIYSVTWSPDSKQILTTSFDKSMKLWDVPGGTLVREFKGFTTKTFEKGHQDQVFTAIFSKDGKTIFSGSSDRRIKKWNVADGSVIGEFANPNVKGEPGQAHPGGVYGLRLTPDEKYLISVGPAPKNKGYVAVWNLADNKLTNGTETNTGPIYSVVLTPDGKNIIVGCGPKVRQVPEAEAVILPLNK